MLSDKWVSTISHLFAPNYQISYTAFCLGWHCGRRELTASPASAGPKKTSGTTFSDARRIVSVRCDANLAHIYVRFTSPWTARGRAKCSIASGGRLVGPA
jgi:hypothetical protein